MGKALGVVMDPIQSIKYNKDTTLSLLLAAQRQGFKLFYMEQRHLFLQDGDPRAEVRPLTVFEDENKWYELGGASSVPLEELDVILMRKDPPFDAEFIYSTYILEAAERRGTLVVNKPQSLRDCNEKVFATQFPQCTPPLLVSRDQNRLKNFLAEHGDVHGRDIIVPRAEPELDQVHHDECHHDQAREGHLCVAQDGAGGAFGEEFPLSPRD